MLDRVIIILQDGEGVHLTDCEVWLRQNVPQGGVVRVDCKWYCRTMEIAFPMNNGTPDRQELPIVRRVARLRVMKFSTVVPNNLYTISLTLG
jgi:hypothetical protein